VLAELFENVLPAYAIVSALALFAGTLLRRVKRGSPSWRSRVKGA